MIKDSGERRRFASGAVRDMGENGKKGRCDLLPLSTIAELLNDSTFDNIEAFQRYGDTDYLELVILNFSISVFGDRNTAMLEVAKHYEEGALKYSERNWERGIPTHCYIDSAVRHYLKFRRGDKDERHDRAFLWNLMCCIWTCDNRPECNDYPLIDDSKKSDKQ